MIIFKQTVSHIVLSVSFVSVFQDVPAKTSCCTLPFQSNPPCLSSGKDVRLESGSYTSPLRTEWQQRLDIGTEENSVHQLDRAAQVTIFRLRTGHCQLLSHLHRLKISTQTNVHAARVLNPPPITSCNPAPLSMT